jgi:hypothetical protein
VSASAGSIIRAKAPKSLGLPGSSGGVVMLKLLRGRGLETIGRLEWVRDRLWVVDVMDRVTKEPKGKRWIQRVAAEQWVVTQEEPR